MKKKQPFVLFELLIAIALFALCAVPLIELPVQALKSEFESLVRVSLPRFSDLAFAKAQEMLYKGEIPLEALKKTEKEKVFLFEDTSSCGKIQIQKKCYLFCSSSKESKEGAKEYLLTLRVELSHPTRNLFFTHHLFCKKQLFDYKLYLRSESST